MGSQGILLSRIRRTRTTAATSLRCRPASKSSRLTLRSEEHTSELQSRLHLVCRLLLEKKKIATLRPPLLSRVPDLPADCLADLLAACRGRELVLHSAQESARVVTQSCERDLPARLTIT